MNRSTVVVAMTFLLAGCAAVPDQPALYHPLAVAAADEVTPLDANTIGQANFNGPNTFQGGTTFDGGLTITGPVTIPSVTIPGGGDGGGGGTPAPAAGPKGSAFLKLDGIEGESTDAHHPKEIVVLSFDWGVSNTAPAAAGSGAGAGKAKFKPIVITKPIDKSSPMLFQSAATGRHIRTGDLTLYKAGAGSPFAECILSDLVVVDISTDHEQMASCNCTESVSMSFARIQWKTNQLGAEGNVLGSVQGVFDLRSNRAALLREALPAELLMPGR